VPYAAQVTAMGGTLPYAWSLASGTLPPGITLAMDGSISGTPTMSGLAVFVVRVMDSGVPSQSKTATLGISILANGSGVQITTASLPGGTVGVPYSASLSAAGGTGPYAFRVASGSLPPGVSLALSGALSGAPTATGSFSFGAQVTDSSMPSQSSARLLTIVVSPPAVQILTPSLPDGVVGTMYSAQVMTSGGQLPLTFSISSGALPAGVSLDAATGIIGGTPSMAETATFTVTVVDSSAMQSRASQSYTVRIAPMSSAFAIETTSLPDGVTGVAYSATLVASGGTMPYTWALNSGTLPAGLTLDPSGVIRGTPTAAGSSNFTVLVSDASMPGRQATAMLTISIRAPLVISTSSLPGGRVGAAYSASIMASGGATPYVFRVSSGALPPGLTLSAQGAISGSPTQVGAFGFTVSATDGSSPQETASANLSITVTGPLLIAQTMLPAGTVGAAYSQALSASGGVPPYQWMVSSGALPTGLMLNAATGVISGTPSSSGTFTFGVTVADASMPAQSAMASFSITINMPTVVTITTASLPGGVTGRAYSASLNAVGGMTPYTWSITMGALPSGLSLDPTRGVILGTPSMAGSFMFTVQVADSSTLQETNTHAFTIVVTSPLAVTTSALPSGITGTAYSATLTASGGTTPYAWSITAGALPPGLSLNATTGVISGTPSSAGSFSFTARVTDASVPQESATVTLSITIAQGVAITTSLLPNGVVGSAYNAQVSAVGGTTPYTFSVSAGVLPSGVSLAAATGALSGTPSTAGTFMFTVRVVDSSMPQQSATASFTVVINGAGVLTITNGALPDGIMGIAYSTQLNAAGGTTPYQWILMGGALPPGFTLSAAGVISGISGSEGIFTFTAQVVDRSTPVQTAERQFSIRISAQLTITTAILPDAVVGSAYSTALAASGGRTPYSWSISGGALPPGLILDSMTGAISGTPSIAGTYNFTIQVADSSVPQQSATANLRIIVDHPLVIFTQVLPNGVVGMAYDQMLRAAGGAPPYTWSIVGGSLPPGLMISAMGVISGTPTAMGTFSFTVHVTDSANPSQSASATLTITVTDILTITTMSLPNGAAGVRYSATLSATGGNLPYVWLILAGALPPGLNLARSGAITGTPLLAGTFNFTVQVIDSTVPRQMATAALSITIDASGTLTITTATLPDAVTGAAYLGNLAATGGTAPYTWLVSSGALPPGLTLNTTTGQITGAPTMRGSFVFTIQVTDSTQPPQTATRSFSIIVADPLAITTTSLPNGIVGNFYAATLTATGGLLPYTWSMVRGQLPLGLQLDPATGTIFGTPAIGGNFSIMVQVADSSTPQQTVTRMLSITIADRLVITTMTLPIGMFNVDYSVTFQASGGTPPLVWSIPSGVLPPGFMFDPATGTLSGRTLFPGQYSFTVRVTDSGTPMQQTEARFILRIL
jgi:hypothetical protein